MIHSNITANRTRLKGRPLGVRSDDSKVAVNGAVSKTVVLFVRGKAFGEVALRISIKALFLWEK